MRQHHFVPRDEWCCRVKRCQRESSFSIAVVAQILGAWSVYRNGPIVDFRHNNAIRSSYIEQPVRATRNRGNKAGVKRWIEMLWCLTVPLWARRVVVWRCPVKENLVVDKRAATMSHIFVLFTVTTVVVFERLCGFFLSSWFCSRTTLCVLVFMRLWSRSSVHDPDPEKKFRNGPIVDFWSNNDRNRSY